MRWDPNPNPNSNPNPNPTPTPTPTPNPYPYPSSQDLFTVEGYEAARVVQGPQKVQSIRVGQQQQAIYVARPSDQ